MRCAAQRGAGKGRDWEAMISSAWDWLAHKTQAACVPPTCWPTTVPGSLQPGCLMNGREALQLEDFYGKKPTQKTHTQTKQIEKHSCQRQRDVQGSFPVPKHRGAPECGERETLFRGAGSGRVRMRAQCNGISNPTRASKFYKIMS